MQVSHAPEVERLFGVTSGDIRSEEVVGSIGQVWRRNACVRSEGRMRSRENVARILNMALWLAFLRHIKKIA